MIEFILHNIVALGLILFLMVGIALAWNIKPMRYALIISLIVVVSITLMVEYGGLKVEKILAKSGYVALFLVWLGVVILFIIGMIKMWNSINKGQQ
ncbi:MAG: hypothetical protein ACPLXN_05150 [Sulfurihydrogenibium sp.]|uniref:hypothetical protein n=1 Tax=Sulfurihydrogenibium sp. TaxID=2053621 RepID=UPI003C79A0E6